MREKIIKKGWEKIVSWPHSNYKKISSSWLEECHWDELGVSLTRKSKLGLKKYFFI